MKERIRFDLFALKHTQTKDMTSVGLKAAAEESSTMRTATFQFAWDVKAMTKKRE